MTGLFKLIFEQYYWCAILPYVLCTALIKWTVGVFVLRFANLPTHRRIIYVTLGIITAYDTGYFITCVFQCTPVTRFWLQFLGEPGTCISRAIITNLSVSAGAMNSAADIILGVVPIFVVMKLQLSFRTRISVGIILALGSMYVLLYNLSFINTNIKIVPASLH